MKPAEILEAENYSEFPDIEWCIRFAADNGVRPVAVGAARDIVELKDIVREWVENGRFLIGNSEEKNALVERSRRALEKK